MSLVASTLTASSPTSSSELLVSHLQSVSLLEQNQQLIEDELEAIVKRAAQSIRAAHAMVIIASNGMGLDCPLPDLRGKQGFWQAFSGLKELGRSSNNGLVSLMLFF